MEQGVVLKPYATVAVVERGAPYAEAPLEAINLGVPGTTGTKLVDLV